MSLLPTKEDRARSEGYAQASKSRDYMIQGLRERIEELEQERDALKAGLRTIQTASEFHSQIGVADHVMRYAHESTARLCAALLGEQE